MNDYRLFRVMLITISVLLLAHSLALLANGHREGIGHVILGMSLFLLFPSTAFMTLIYAIYIEVATSKSSRLTHYCIALYSIPFTVGLLLNTVSEFTGWFFYLDNLGYFHNGPYLAIPVLISFSYIFMAMFTIVKRKKQMSHHEFINHITIPLPILIAGTIQSYIQEIPILLPGCVLSLFLIFSNIQERRLSFDHLTGAYNRQKLDEFLELMIENSHSSGILFSAFLADVNKFKAINDTYGHTEGDKALIKVVETIRSEIRNIDFLARYAGDEFVAIFPKCGEDELSGIIERIHRRFSHTVITDNKYQLSVSIGAASFIPDTDRDSEKYIKRLDTLMYESKRDFHNKS